MAAHDMPGIGLKGGYALGEDDWGDDLNANLLKLSTLVQAGVKGFVAAVPDPAVAGDVYVLTAAPNANSIAVWSDNEETPAGFWTYYAPQEGWEVYDRDQNKKMRFDGAAWAEVVAGGGGGGDGSIIVSKGATSIDPVTEIVFSGTGVVVTDGGDGKANVNIPGGGGGGGGTSYEFPIDEPPADPSPFDDEFEGADLDAAWTWVNKSSAGATAYSKVKSGMLRIGTDIPIGGQNVRLLVKDRPAGDFDIVAKCRLLGLGRDYHQAILAVYNSANGKFVESRLHYRGYGALYFAWAQWNSVTSGGTETNLATVVNKGYLRFKLTGTTLKTMISPDGYYWDLLHTENLADFVGVGMDKIALAYDCETTAINFEAGFEWIRDYGPDGPPDL